MGFVFMCAANVLCTLYWFGNEVHLVDLGSMIAATFMFIYFAGLSFK